MRNLLLVLLIAAGIFTDPVGLCAAMSSTNYYIYSDDFSLGGGLSTGGSYNLQDTIGNSPVNTSTGGSYSLKAGYQFQTRGTISMTISSSSLDLGTLTSAGASSTAATVATITTDSDTGYVLSISDVGGTSLTAVADGAVDGAGGSEEYGLGLSGVDIATTTDAAVVSGLVLASNASPVTSNATTLTFKAARGTSSLAGTKSQSVTLSAVANF